jgi:3-oxoacyl-[acyl-carrier protein] reductase
MDFELSDRVAIITGCSVGIGREVAKVLASEGVQTVVIARRGGLLATLQEEIVAAGGPRPQAMAVDVKDTHAPQTIVEATLAHFGRLDILINNAGGSRPTAVDAPDAIWEESIKHVCQPCRRNNGGVLSTSPAHPSHPASTQPTQRKPQCMSGLRGSHASLDGTVLR